MKTHTRRVFLKRAAIVTGLIFLPTDVTRPGMWLYDARRDDFVYVPLNRGGGLQAASVIKSRTFSSTQDNRIQLSNSNFARKWSTVLGSSWTKLRVGCRITTTVTGGNLSGSPRFSVGIQSGTTNLYMDAGGPTHWAGVITFDTGWLRSTPSGVETLNFWNSSAPPAFSKKIATTVTSATAGDLIPRAHDATTENRACYFVDITKGSPNFTGTFFGKSANSSGDVSLATYLAQVATDAASITNHGFSTSQTLAVSEGTNGTFDSIGIAWDRTDAKIELSDIAIVRLS